MYNNISIKSDPGVQIYTDTRNIVVNMELPMGKNVKVPKDWDKPSVYLCYREMIQIGSRRPGG